MHDYWGTQVKEVVGFDVGTAYFTTSDSNWMTFGFGPNPIAQNWLKMSNLKMIYEVPFGVNPMTEVWITEGDLLIWPMPAGQSKF